MKKNTQPGRVSPRVKKDGRITQVERDVISKMKKLAEKSPDAKHPNIEFIRNWAYGNAGLENESITREQVDRVIKRK